MLIRGNVTTRAAYIDTVRMGQCQTAPLPVLVSTITLDTTDYLARHDRYHIMRFDSSIERYQHVTAKSERMSVNCPV
jgi:hypothetical protein